MHRATLGKSGSEAASQLLDRDGEIILQQQFFENHGNACCYLIHFDISIIIWLSKLL